MTSSVYSVCSEKKCPRIIRSVQKKSLVLRCVTSSGHVLDLRTNRGRFMPKLLGLKDNWFPFFFWTDYSSIVCSILFVYLLRDGGGRNNCREFQWLLPSLAHCYINKQNSAIIKGPSIYFFDGRSPSRQKQSFLI